MTVDVNGDGLPDPVTASFGDDKLAWYANMAVPIVVSTATPYGVGCGTPSMGFAPTSTAVIGTSITGVVTDTPTAVCAVAIGFSDTMMPSAGSLPLDLGAVGMTGCTLQQSSDIFGLGTVSSGQPFTRHFSWPLPNNNALLGAYFFAQAFSYAPGANPLQVVASNGIEWLIWDL